MLKRSQIQGAQILIGNSQNPNGGSSWESQYSCPRIHVPENHLAPQFRGDERHLIITRIPGGARPAQAIGVRCPSCRPQPRDHRPPERLCFGSV